MSKHFEILDNEWHNKPLPKSDLLRLRLRSVRVPTIFLLAYWVVQVTHLFDWKYGSGFVAGLWLGTILNVMYSGNKAFYIYDYTLADGQLNLDLVSFLGKFSTFSIPVKQIVHIKFRKKNIWREMDKMWIQTDQTAKSFVFLKQGLGDSLVEKIPVEVV